MSNITLPASFPPAGSGGQTATAVPGTIPDPPRGLLDLASGTLLKGEVIGHDRQGHVLIRTPEGVLPVASRAQLPEGSQVTLQIRSHGAQLHISVLQVDGHSPRLRPSAPGAGAPDASAPGTGDPQPAPRPGTRPAGPPNSAPDSAPNSVTTRGPAISTAANPTPTSLPAIPDGAAGPRLPGRVTHAPPAAASLPNGAVLSGTVLGTDVHGQLLVRTDAGTLAIATDANAKTGSQVTLQIRASTATIGVVITLPDSAKPAPAGATARPAATAPPAAPGKAPGAIPLAGGVGHQAPTADVLTLGQTVQAKVEVARAATPPAPDSAASAAPPAPGTAASRPGPAPSAGPSPSAGSFPSAAAPLPPALPNTATPASPRLPAAGTTLPVRVVEVTLPGNAPAPGTSATPAASADGAPRITGQVIGQTARGQPLVDTPLGRLSLEVTSELPRGTQLVLEPPRTPWPGAPPRHAPLQHAPLALATGGDPAEPTQLAFRWPALESALEILRGFDAPLAEALTSGQGNGPALPSPGPRLASSLLFFLAALNGGDPGEWLSSLAGGQFARALEERGRNPLLRQLAADLGQMGRLTDSSGDWRLLAIPFADGHQVHPLRLFLRRDRHGSRDSDQERETATRFVFEVELTRIGDLQMDGLVRGKRFDLILRTRRPLSPIMQRDIAEIFQAANAAAGIEGQMVFQASSDWRPMPVGDDTLHLGEVVA